MTYFQGGVRRRGLLPVTGRVARLTWALLIMSITCGALPALGQTPEADQANAIYAEFWDRFAQDFPEYATFRSDNRYDEVLPAQAIVRVPSQIDAWLAPDVTGNPAQRPFVDMPAGIPEAVRTRLPKLFAELPRLPYGVRAMEAFEGDNSDHYTPFGITDKHATVEVDRYIVGSTNGSRAKRRGIRQAE